jgi:hypothetical protein
MSVMCIQKFLMQGGAPEDRMGVPRETKHVDVQMRLGCATKLEAEGATPAAHIEADRL